MAATNDVVRQKLSSLGVQGYELEWLFDVLDTDNSGYLSIDEFVDGVLRTKESEIACQLMQMQYTILRELANLQTSNKNGDQKDEKEIDHHHEHEKHHRPGSKFTAQQSTQNRLLMASP